MLRLLCLVCILSFKVSVMCDNASLENHLVSASRLNDLVGQLEAVLQIEAVNKDKVSSSSTEFDSPSSWTIVPPKYMIDLYHKYADDKFIWDTDPSKTTTIRCILGKVRRESVHFNLTSLLDTKSISHAEIHVFRRTRRGKSSSSRSKFSSSSAQHRIRLRNLPKKLFLSTIISLLPSRGWQAVDITNTVKTSLGKGKFLSMTVEASIPEFGSLGRERYHTIPVDEALRLAYRPFLVIFSSTDVTPTVDVTTISPPPPPPSSTSFSPASWRKTSTKKELSTSSWLNGGKFEENYGGGGEEEEENVDELENSLMSILNIDKMTTTTKTNNNEANKGLAERGGIENNEISQSDSSSMDHFHLIRSDSSSKRMPMLQLLGKIPLINHSSSSSSSFSAHSMGKRSIADNEFSEDPESPLLFSRPHQHHPPPPSPPSPSDSPEEAASPQKDSNNDENNENSLNDADDHSNSLLLPFPPITSTFNDDDNDDDDDQDDNDNDDMDDDGQFLLRQDNLDNGLSPSSPSSIQQKKKKHHQQQEEEEEQKESSKESNPNPILPFPSRHRWWNQPLDHSWSPSSSSSKGRERGGGRRRGGKTTNRRKKKKKLRRNRQGKKYWTSEKNSLPPPPSSSSSSSPPKDLAVSASAAAAAKSQARDAQLFYKESKERKKKKKFPTSFYSSTSLLLDQEKEEEQECRLEELSVDTANVDWAERIIAPAVLPLNYCQGSCSPSASSSSSIAQLTNSQGLADSSHEAMLDFNSVDLDYAAPPPPPPPHRSSSSCCVPAAKKRFVVLFSDIHDNIVLRIHPNVTPVSCQFL